MELLAPDLSLIVWTFLALVAVVLAAIALFFLLTTKTKSYPQEFLWLLAILFLPLIGSTSYLVYRKKQKLLAIPSAKK